jgi:hypothetical protein
MDDLFNMLSSSARLDKSKRKQKSAAMMNQRQNTTTASQVMKQIKKGQGHDGSDSDASSSPSDSDNDDDDDRNSITNNNNKKQRPKKQHSAKKLAQIHQEEINAFRRRMGIRLSSDNKHEIETIPDPISSFKEWKCPQWWSNRQQQEGGNNNNNSNNNNNKSSNNLFDQLHQTILNNIEQGRWMEPTPSKCNLSRLLWIEEMLWDVLLLGVGRVVLLYYLH